MEPATLTVPNRTPDGATSVVKFHASLNVSDLARSVEFYTALLGTGPVKHYPDYAKYELADPPLVLSLKPKRACAGGPLNHLGLRLVAVEHLRAVHERLKAVGARVGTQDDVKCCYALQTKLWITDPDGTLWEVYVLHDDVPDWGEKHKKVKLLAAPFKAFGIRGLIRRAWNNKFGPRAEPAPADPAEAAVGAGGLLPGAVAVIRPAMRVWRAAGERLGYWPGLSLRWGHQMAHNGYGIIRVLDITKLRPLPAGLIGPDHPWATGLDPATGQPIWHANVLYRSPRDADALKLPADDEIVTRNGRFLADRVTPSTVTPELPIGPHRRMPHGINYIHGTSHYNSGTLIFTDFRDGLRHLSDRRFRDEIHRFALAERRELLMLFRQRDYTAREFAYFACAVRTLFGWFCNSNGPRGRVLWGNAAPFPAANLITGAWVDDVYALKRPGGADAVVRPPISPGVYFTGGPYGGPREAARWPEKALAWVTYWRIRARGGKGGVFFADRRRVYADQIAARHRAGAADEPIARL